MKHLYCQKCHAYPDLVFYVYPDPLEVKTIWTGNKYAKVEDNALIADAQRQCGDCRSVVIEKVQEPA